MAAAGPGRDEVNTDEAVARDDVEGPTVSPDAVDDRRHRPAADGPDAGPERDADADADAEADAEADARAPAVVVPVADAPAAWPHRRRARRLLLTIAVVGVVLGVAGVLAPRLQARADDAAARGAATDAATQFVVDINTYDSADAGEYQQRMDPQLTPAYRKEFDELTTKLFTVLAPQAVVSRDARVRGTAVDSIDDDSATVLVAASRRVTNTRQTTPLDLPPLRWRVELARRDGQWLVARYQAVASQGSEGAPAVPQQGATPAPSAAPTPTVPSSPGTTP